MWSQSLRFIFACHVSLSDAPVFFNSQVKYKYIGSETSVKQARGAQDGLVLQKNHGSHWLDRTIEEHTIYSSI
jgi:hypothetical protein